MNAALRAQQRYRDDAVLSAPPERLVTMLYDRLLLDIERGEAAQRAGDWAAASTHLQHAQAIVAELSGSLTDAWDGSDGLARAVHLRHPDPHRREHRPRRRPHACVP
ncbi:flagellar export chaperone FliS [Microbacterium elymi]|uniref:flagellar export chaperone FliS n=1 Tax=Microbacterium elymi TaxID=2909587 RepID=UPI00338F855A